jgi:broad specificity phosphatase PhoE
MEQNGGVLDGLTWDEIEAKYPNLYPAPEELIDWNSVVGAESNLLASNRAAKVINSVISHHSNDDAVLMFAHGGIIQHMVASLLGTDRFWGIGVHNTAIFEFTVDQTRWFSQGAELKNNLIWWIGRFNDASHL